jgi:hypothetical protein
MAFWTKKTVEVPVSDETKQIEAVELTYVKWKHVTGYYTMNEEPRWEAFPSEKEANEFADSLRAAMKLLQHVEKWSHVEVYKKK